MNRTWLYRVIEVVPRRTRLNVATLGVGLLVLILTTCCHFHQVGIQNLQFEASIKIFKIFYKDFKEF